jgi:hypothetical protein
MAIISNEEMDKIKEEVEKEFPGDPALQQVHIARKIISKEAELEGMDFFEYIQSISAKNH